MEPQGTSTTDASVDEQSTQPVDDSTVTDEQPADAAQAELTNVVEAPAEATPEEEEDYGYPEYNLPANPGIDFSTLPSGEDGLIDPNALAASINQQIATAEERATQKAMNAFQEQQAETRAWDKAIEKYPDLKSNKDLRDMIQQTRIGQFSEALNRNVAPQDIKLKTPMQVAETFFKHIGTAKAEGMKQATTNTVVQQSAYTESASRRSNDTGDNRTKARQNINNPNKEVATKARTDLLRSMVFGDN